MKDDDCRRDTRRELTRRSESGVENERSTNAGEEPSVKRGPILFRVEREKSKKWQSATARREPKERGRSRGGEDPDIVRFSSQVVERRDRWEGTRNVPWGSQDRSCRS